MDDRRFDAITRTLAATRPRRVTLRVLAASALGFGLSRLGLAEVAAGCKHLGQHCDQDKDCCNGLNCKQKKCACKRGKVACGNTCCARGQQCVENGQGRPFCCAPENACGDGCCARDQKCIEDSKAPPFCCAPTNVCGPLCCPPDRLCVGKSLPPPAQPSDPNDLYECICRHGFEDAESNCACTQPCGEDCCNQEDGEVCCSARRGPKQCVHLDSNENNCGECGNRCPKGANCQDGKCVCAPSSIVCNGTCVQPDSDPANCGGCDNQCPQDRICQGGECVCPDYECAGTCLPSDGCCSDIDCWVYSNPDQEYVCCSGPACEFFSSDPYRCYWCTDGGDDQFQDFCVVT